MKHSLWPIVILIIAVLFAFMSRYVVIVKPPVVVKLDQFTGDSWIVNSGYWVKVKDAPADEPPQPQEPADTSRAKAE